MKHSFAVLSILALSFSISAQSQDNIKGNILFKDYPYLVLMTSEGDILEFLNTAPEILKGSNFAKDLQPPVALGPYTKPQSIAASQKEYNSPLNTTIISDGDEIIADNENSNNESVEQPVEPEMKTTVIRKEKEVVDQPKVVYKETNDESVEKEFNYDLQFQGFTARLTPVLINQLKDISKDYETNSTKEVYIRSFLTAGDNTNKKLAKNRMEACKDLLETYGIPSDKIHENIESYRSSNPAQVNITLE